MALVLWIWQGKQLVAYTLIRWNPLQDTAVVIDGEQQKTVKLSTALPFSKGACNQIKEKPAMLSPAQAQALLTAASKAKEGPDNQRVPRNAPSCCGSSQSETDIAPKSSIALIHIFL